MMRKFLSHLIMFAVIGYLVMTVMDVGLSRVASSSHYGATECCENLMKGRIDADCVILGSSRAMNHVDAYTDSLANDLKRLEMSGLAKR